MYERLVEYEMNLVAKIVCAVDMLESQKWVVNDWEKALFSDKTKICLFGGDGRKYVRCPTGTRYNSR